MMSTSYFNSYRFDLVVAYAMHKLHRPMRQYAMVKMHALVDAVHFARTGRPVIGGQLLAMKHGPVAKPALWRAVALLEGEGESECFSPPSLDRKGNATLTLRDDYQPDLDEFSPSELKAMDDAVQVLALPMRECYRYLHGTSETPSFLGNAWKKVHDKYGDSPAGSIERSDLVNEYEAITGEKAPFARLTLAMSGE